MKTLLIQGLEDGAGPGDIVGAITGEAEIPGELIGNIEIEDNYATVEIDSNVADLVIEKMNNDTIGGDRVSVRYYRDDDPERLAEVASYVERLSDRLQHHRDQHDAAVRDAAEHRFTVRELEQEPSSTFLLDPAEETPQHHGLRAGDAVTVVHDGGEHRSRLLRVEDGAIVVRVGGGLYEPLGDTVTVRQRQDPLAFNRMHHAVHEMNRVNGEIEDVRDRIVGIEPITEAGSAEIDGIDLRLDADQEAAVEAVLGSQDVALVQAPPGTGGSRVMTATAVHAAADGDEVLVAAASPASMAALLTTMADTEIDPVCVASTHDLPESQRRLTLRRRVQETDAWEQADQLRDTVHEHHDEQQDIEATFDPEAVDGEAIREAAARGESVADRSADETAAIARWLELQDEIEEKERRIDRYEQRAYEIVLRNADVVCATALDAGWPLLSRIDFDTVLLHGAEAIPEPMALIPLQHGDRAVMIGDPCQLPYQGAGWATEPSLFERLCDRTEDAVIHLWRQYRTHPSILAYPDQRFYDGRLRPVHEDGSYGGLVHRPAGDTDALLDQVRAVVEAQDDTVGIIAATEALAEQISARMPDSPVAVIEDARYRRWDTVVIAVPDPAMLQDERWLNTAVLRADTRCVVVGPQEPLEERFPVLMDTVSHMDEGSDRS